MSHARGRRPAILRVGQVSRSCGGPTLVTDWQLGLCATGCACHVHPQLRRLVLAPIDSMPPPAVLGLARFAPCAPWPDGGLCCAPWTLDELLDFTAELADLEALTHTG